MRSKLLALAIGSLMMPARAAVSADGYDFRLTETRLDCKERIAGGGFDKCEVYTVVRIAAPPTAILEVFGSCEATVSYRLGGDTWRQHATLFEKFYAAVVDGSGLAPVSLWLDPLLASLNPIVDAKVEDLTCKIDEVYDK